MAHLPEPSSTWNQPGAMNWGATTSYQCPALSIYLRGEACLAAGFPDKALAEFQKILDTPADWELPFGAWLIWASAGRMRWKRYSSCTIHENQAHILIERSNAGRSYQGTLRLPRFFALWKDADSDIPS